MPHEHPDKAPLNLKEVAAFARAAADAPTPLGGFSPGMVELGDEGLALKRDGALTPAQRWAAHLSEPARLSDAIYMPPELDGGRASEAADVYSVAVMTYLAAVGDVPVGALNAPVLDRALGRPRARTVVQALSPLPATRPRLDTLATELAEAARPPDTQAASADDEAAAGGPSSSSSTTGAGDGVPVARADERRRSFLQPMLLVGAFSVFVGALWFIWLSWGQIGDGLRLLMIALLTALVGGLSVGLERAECQEAAGTFRVLFTQLFWAVGGFLLLVTDTIGSGLGWACVGLGVAAVSAGVGHLKGPRWVLNGLAGLAGAASAVALFTSLDGWGEVCFFAGAAVIARGLLALAESGRLKLPVKILEVALVGLVWLTTWWALANLMKADPPLWTMVAGAAWVATRLWAHRREATHLAVLAHLAGVPTMLLVLVFSGGGANIWPSLTFVLMAALEVVLLESLGRHRRSDVAIAAGTLSLWLVGFTIADAVGSVGSGELALVGGLCWLATAALAWWRRGLLCSGAAAVHLLVASAFLGEHLSTGTWYGAAVYFFVVELAFIALALLLFRARDALQKSHLFGAAFMALASTVVAIGVLVEGGHDLFGTLFPYVPALALAPLLFAGDELDVRSVLGRLAAAAFLVIPGVELVVRSSSAPLAIWAAVVGLVGAGAALLASPHRPLLERSRHALLWIGAALGGLVVWVCFQTAVGKPLHGELAWVLLLAAVTGAFYGLGLGAEHLARHTGASTDGRRMQLAAAAGYLAPFFIWSLARPDDYGHAVLLVVGGVALLALGVKQRHRHVVLGSAGTLIATFWIQFFVKLHDKAPIALLLIAFGVAMLAFAVLYERRLKHLVSAVRSWPGI